MSSPGFTGGGGASEFFGGAGGFAGRSIPAATAMNNPNATASVANNLHPLYRTQQQLPAMFLDPSSQITQRPTPSVIGKRTLTEFQTSSNTTNNNLNLNHNQVLSNLLLRSVKPRTTFTHTSPMSAMDYSIPEIHTQRFGAPLLHQLRPQPINLPNNGSIPINGPNFSYRNSNLGLPQNRVQIPVPAPVQSSEPEKKTMDHRLQELAKQLLEDNDDEGEADAASVITTSEWSETYQNLISPGPTAPVQKPVSSSPTSSTTSSTSSSSSVASPASGCFKQTLMEAASAITEGKNDSATEILNRLAQGPNQTGNSDQRLTDCMVSALKSRMNPVENPPPVAELFSREHAESTQLLLENSVCFKVGFMAANFAILEAAFEEKTENRFCVVDFDIGQGKQYLHLLNALSARSQNGKVSTVKIVAVAENGAEERVRAVGEMLSRQAERLRIGFELRVVVTQKLAELTRESLGCDADEAIMVNFAYKLNKIPDESVSTENPRDELLRRVKRLVPRVVTIVEQEMNANTAPFLARVAESLSYYSSLFDSIEATVGRDNPNRVKVEEGLSRKMCNSVACEGRDRVERCEVFGKWRARMSMAGFQLKPLSQNLAESIKSLLASGNNRVNPALTVKEENGGICFGWMGRTLTVASAWR
ncbi:scarecrow-like protein 8 [Abrus precatorius]|uniref:Scarecrow-like protein 8 n=1 Tax=Abrus precatorius TaxID=3816 RepID=A0A8B8LP91_ABRPR|nr:scarecrow-like protein 8 [Abrus precatorius]